MFNIFKQKKGTEEARLQAMLLNEDNERIMEEVKDLSLNKDRIISELTRQLVFTSSALKSTEELLKLNNDLEEVLNKKIAALEETVNKNSKKLDALQQDNYKLSLLIPNKFPYEKIMDECASAAWSGCSSTRLFVSSDGKCELLFEGTVYEPTYEYFVPGCCVYAIENGKKTTLYSIDSRNVEAYKNETVEIGSTDGIKAWLEEKNYGFTEVKKVHSA